MALMFNIKDIRRKRDFMTWYQLEYGRHVARRHSTFGTGISFINNRFRKQGKRTIESKLVCKLLGSESKDSKLAHKCRSAHDCALAAAEPAHLRTAEAPLPLTQV